MPEDPAIATLFDSLRKSLASAVRRIVPAKEVEDIVQETYVRLCLVEKPSEIKSPRSFMFEVARNLAKDHVKRAESRLVDAIGDDDELSARSSDDWCDDTLDRVSAEQEFSIFCNAIRSLPPQCRRAFVLRKVYGYSQREIARAMKISEKTVEKHIANGLKRCSYSVSGQLSDGSKIAGGPIGHRAAGGPIGHRAKRRSGGHL
ncbi:MAG TPA: sigma-70 family RNA polymerase sigma factor [Woeseiaceae bacterium]|nr:sigma-70 family RNA polymerase sigma factor [Woeseiaceae bacterium]